MELHVMFFVLFFSLFVLSAIIHIQLWAASTDGLRPTRQPAIIYTLFSTTSTFLRLIKLLLLSLSMDTRRHIWRMTVNWLLTLVIIGYARLSSSQHMHCTSATWFWNIASGSPSPRHWTCYISAAPLSNSDGMPLSPAATPFLRFSKARVSSVRDGLSVEVFRSTQLG